MKDQPGSRTSLRAVNIMCYNNVGQGCLAIGSVEQLMESRATPIPTGWAQVMPPSPAPAVKKQNSHRRLSKRNLVNTQRLERCSHQIFSSRGARAMNAHEVVRNNNSHRTTLR
jgi:hypothetical protein